MARARPVPGLREDTSYAEAARQVVAVRAAELVEHSAGVLEIADIDRVHDMRVATRRLRAALEIFEPCFPRKRFKRARREVKRLADALGERRDRDVAIRALSEFADGTAQGERRGVESLIERLRAEQAEANAALAEAVAPKRLAVISAQLDELAAPRRR